MTKIVSVAEEAENPGRNIPRGILGSILTMLLVYAFLAFVVGVAPPETLQTSLTPVALAADSARENANRRPTDRRI